KTYTHNIDIAMSTINHGFIYRVQKHHTCHITDSLNFAQLADATLCVLYSLGLGLAYTRRRKSLCVTAACYVRYVRELRAGDNVHIVSGVIGVERDGLVLGHKVFNSETGEVCTTVEERPRHVDTRRRAARPFTAAQRRPPAQR